MLFFSSSCEDKKSKVKLESQLPKAKGGFSDIIVVVDNIAWKQTLKLTFDSLLAPEVSGLYSPEPEFDLINVSHSGFKGLSHFCNAASTMAANNKQLFSLGLILRQLRQPSRIPFCILAFSFFSKMKGFNLVHGRSEVVVSESVLVMVT